jgi:hypothetical protein
VLAAGAGLLVVSHGRWVVPLAAWLAPVLLLRFGRRVHGAAGYLGLYAAIAGASAVMWWGMAPLRGTPYAAFIAATALALAAPLWLAAWYARRRDDFVGTLLLPSAWVSSEFLVSLASPFGTWGAVAYTQGGNLALLQLVSVTGIWGIAFLIGWAAAVVNWAWDRPWPETRRGVLACASVLAALLLGGEARLTLLPRPGLRSGRRPSPSRGLTMPGASGGRWRRRSPPRSCSGSGPIRSSCRTASVASARTWSAIIFPRSESPTGVPTDARTWISDTPRYRAGSLPWGSVTVTSREDICSRSAALSERDWPEGPTTSTVAGSPARALDARAIDNATALSNEAAFTSASCLRARRWRPRS